MALSGMRRWSRLVAVLLLCTAARLPHLAADDFACVDSSAPAYAGHDETKHGLRPATSDDDGEHCAVCHWTRTLRSPRAVVGMLYAGIEPASVLHATSGRAFSTAIARNLPARAPPSQLL